MFCRSGPCGDGFLSRDRELDYTTKLPLLSAFPLILLSIMSLCCRNTLRRCASAAKSAYLPRVTSGTIYHLRRWQTTDAAAAASNPKIAGIVDQISQLTLLETADLVSSLKVSLNCITAFFDVI
jgi:hypothetical protein